jgi:hypothetical protein
MLVDAPVAIKSLELAIQKRNLTDLEAEFISNLRVYPVDSGEQVKKSKIDISVPDPQWVMRDYEIVCHHLKMCIQLLNQFSEWGCEPDQEPDGTLDYSGFDHPPVARLSRELLKVIDP